jgi:hypothetical protein
LRYSKKIRKEGNDSKVAVIFYTTAKESEEGDSSIIAIAFFATLQQEKMKKATTTLMSSLSWLH